MSGHYDAIVVGARCAGSPTAMLLARRGYRVLLVDRASFPSDTVSTHVIHAPGVAALSRWGLLPEVLATGCPPLGRYSVDFGPFVVAGLPLPSDGISSAYAPRRTILDKVLVDGAADAGAEVRERFTVQEVVVEDGVVTGIRGRGHGGGPVLERARLVIGADGTHSRVAEAVGAPRYHEKPTLQAGYYSYWSDLPLGGFETYARPGSGWGAVETNDGLTMLVVGRQYADLPAFRSDIEATFFGTLEQDPAFADRVRGATREDRFTGASAPNFFRKPFGPGWALVGDAGYTKDPITAQGITDAFLDAERCAEAVDQAFRGHRSFAAAMAEYQRARDERALPVYDFTTQLATMEPPPPELQQLLSSIQDNPAACDAFVSVIAATMSPAQFFDPAHLATLIGAPASA